MVLDMPVGRGVSKRIKDGHSPPILWAGHPRIGRKAVLGMAHLQGVEGSGMTQRSQQDDLRVAACRAQSVRVG
jgi:hypothetical protein